MTLRAPARASVGALVACALGVVFVGSLAFGAVPVPTSGVIGALASLFGVDLGVDPLHAAVVLELRLPRAAGAVAVGASLGTAGALLQGLFRNPLAEPSLVGVTSGASFAAAAVSVLGPTAGVSLPLAAFTGGLLATGAVLGLSAGTTRGAGLVLAGLGVAAICNAMVGLLLFVADDAALRSFTFWTLGSVAGVSWPQVAGVTVTASVAGGVAVANHRALDVWLLGEEDAMALGVPVARLRWLVVGLGAALVGVTVSICGAIGFVGLAAPHAARRMVGHSHRAVVPGSAAVGALIVLLADTAARTVAEPAEVPIGVLTTAVGGPLLLWLARKAG